MLVDTHAHLYLEDFQAEWPEMTQRARKAGVGHVFLPNIDENTIKPLQQLIDTDPEYYKGAMGLHPCSVTEDWPEQLEVLRSELDRGEYVAIGETGTDRYWDTNLIEQQEEAFREQLRWGRETGLPVIIHSRDSLDQNIEIVSELQDGRLRGIFHCFNGDIQQGRKILDLGFLLGLGGVITFKNAGMDEVLPHLPLEGMVLETDAPYLAPVPFRGKRNESAYVRYVANRLCEIMGKSMEEIETITSKVALTLFFQELEGNEKSNFAD